MVANSCVVVSGRQRYLRSCHQAHLQSILKALMSDQIAEVRQNAKLAVHALATLSIAEVRPY
jgi:hypothetical protein